MGISIEYERRASPHLLTQNLQVETVGDKYVAVAGVPYARNDHVMAMARFARSCIQEFGKTLQVLERKLG